MPSDFLDAAISYAKRGWGVIPLGERSKIPVTTNGKDDATSDVEVITEWWSKYKNDNLAIATGSKSNGLVVIDLDEHDPENSGYDVLHAWEKEHGELPETVTALTGSGGMHMLYIVDELVFNSVGKGDFAGVDIRGEGGYIVAPPSIHPDTGATYEWENDPSEYKVAMADSNVKAFLKAIAASNGGSVDGKPKKKFKWPDVVKKGERNDTIFRGAAQMQAYGWDDLVILAECESINKLRCNPSLPSEEVLKIVQSVISRYKKGEPLPDEKKEEKLKRQKSSHDEFGDLLITEDHFCFVDGAPAVWDGERYATGWDEVYRMIVKHNKKCKQTEQREICHYVKLQAPKVEASDPQYIAFKNGVLDTVSGVLDDDKSKYVITNVVPHNYNPVAYSKIADDFLTSIACGDHDIRANLEEVIGLCMYRSNEYGQCPILLGNGSNGKSTYINTLRYILGIENVSSLDLNILGERFQAARLIGKLANLGDDISNEYLKGNILAVFKKIVTGDWVYSDVKGGDGLEFKPYCTLIFSANEMPNLGDSSDGMMRRLFPIPFDAQFSRMSENYDPQLSKKLRTTEATEYFIRVGIEGLVRMRASNGLTENERTKQMVESVRVSNNNVLQWIEDNGIEREDVVGKTTEEVYENYADWCRNAGAKSVVKIKFIRSLTPKFNVKSSPRRVETADGVKSKKIFVEKTTD